MFQSDTFWLKKKNFFLNLFDLRETEKVWNEKKIRRASERERNLKRLRIKVDKKNMKIYFVMELVEKSTCNL